MNKRVVTLRLYSELENEHISLRIKAANDLVVDALEILRLDLPEFHLNVRNWIESFQQRLSRVLLEHFANLVRPLDDHGLDGVHQSPE